MRITRVFTLFDIFTILLWLGYIGLLITCTVLEPDAQVPQDTKTLLAIWQRTIGQVALGCTLVSVARYILRRVEEMFGISRNVREIHNELDALRERRLRSTQ